jgi:hypothetical protein
MSKITAFLKDESGATAIEYLGRDPCNGKRDWHELERQVRQYLGSIEVVFDLSVNGEGRV